MRMHERNIFESILHSSCNCSGEVRLVNGTGQYEGRLETCSNGVWKTVCDDYLSSSNQIASVVCGELGYPQRGNYSYDIVYYYTKFLFRNVCLV